MKKDTAKLALKALTALDSTLEFTDWENGDGEVIGEHLRELVATLEADIAEVVEPVEKDAVFQAAIDFIGTLTGMTPPPIEVAPPETFEPFRVFTEKVCEIFTAPQEATAPAQSLIPKDWLLSGSLLYRLNPDYNYDEINVTMANGLRTDEAREERACELLALMNGGAA
ncbi:MAG: hypothetical protein HHJ15_16605 [Rhodoferax sp.]|uniref:hypothetical protein n=1 Tax=Rhodoferax sp. TaxID=50421 RepID=UPI00182AF3DC|nr:hypothetical protein [Rhodoferax sp.]NMM21550.1 hypothetical protein [Rhodoferax sp.]